MCRKKAAAKAGNSKWLQATESVVLEVYRIWPGFGLGRGSEPSLGHTHCPSVRLTAQGPGIHPEDNCAVLYPAKLLTQAEKLQHAEEATERAVSRLLVTSAVLKAIQAGSELRIEVGTITAHPNVALSDSGQQQCAHSLFAWLCHACCCIVPQATTCVQRKTHTDRA